MKKTYIFVAAMMIVSLFGCKSGDSVNGTDGSVMDGGTDVGVDLGSGSDASGCRIIDLADTTSPLYLRRSSSNGDYYLLIGMGYLQGKITYTDSVTEYPVRVCADSLCGGGGQVDIDIKDFGTSGSYVSSTSRFLACYSCGNDGILTPTAHFEVYYCPN